MSHQFGKGAIDSPRDIRDFKANRLLGAGPLPFNWSEGVDIIAKVGEIPVENQFASSSCGGQALRYYLEALKRLHTGTFERLSAHDPYCQVFYPQGGTTIRDIAKLAVQVGIKSEAVVPSYINGDCTEYFMRDKSLTTATPAAPKFAEFGYAFPKTDIETIACAIRDNNGAILQVTGYNNQTWLTMKPSTTVEGPAWSHFVWACGAQVIEGKRYIKILNSWGNIGNNGFQFLSEDFFQGPVTNALVFFDTQFYSYNPTVVQSVTPTWLQKFLNFWANYFLV